MMASRASSGTRLNLLFCRFNISKEFKFSKAIIGNVLILNTKIIGTKFRLVIIGYKIFTNKPLNSTIITKLYDTIIGTYYLK